MQRLQPNESEIVGAWVYEAGVMESDGQTKRIEWLIEHVLERIAFSPVDGAWETLFRDPGDGRFWERTYPQGEMHGGGPQALRCLTTEEAASKYRLPNL